MGDTLLSKIYYSIILSIAIIASLVSPVLYAQVEASEKTTGGEYVGSLAYIGSPITIFTINPLYLGDTLSLAAEGIGFNNEQIAFVLKDNTLYQLSYSGATKEKALIPGGNELLAIVVVEVMFPEKHDRTIMALYDQDLNLEKAIDFNSGVTIYSATTLDDGTIVVVGETDSKGLLVVAGNGEITVYSIDNIDPVYAKAYSLGDQYIITWYTSNRIIIQTQSTAKAIDIPNPTNCIAYEDTIACLSGGLVKIYDIGEGRAYRVVEADATELLAVEKYSGEYIIAYRTENDRLDIIVGNGSVFTHYTTLYRHTVKEMYYKPVYATVHGENLIVLYTYSQQQSNIEIHTLKLSLKALTTHISSSIGTTHNAFVSIEAIEQDIGNIETSITSTDYSISQTTIEVNTLEQVDTSISEKTVSPETNEFYTPILKVKAPFNQMICINQTPPEIPIEVSLQTKSGFILIGKEVKLVLNIISGNTTDTKPLPFTKKTDNRGKAEFNIADIIKNLNQNTTIEFIVEAEGLTINGTIYAYILPPPPTQTPTITPTTTPTNATTQPSLTNTTTPTTTAPTGNTSTTQPSGGAPNYTPLIIGAIIVVIVIVIIIIIARRRAGY